MAAKYFSGARVRIRDAQRGVGALSDVRRYRDQIGQIIGSTALIAFAARPWTEETSVAVHLLQVYKVRLDVGIEIDYVTEDCLEVFEQA